MAAHEALERLREGNRLFASGELSRETARRGAPSHSAVLLGPRESNHSAGSSQSQNLTASS